MTTTKGRGFHKRHTEETKKRISKSRIGKGMGKNNGKWNGGIGCYRKYVTKYKCEDCGRKNELIVHHKDRDRHNNIIENLKVICTKCHCKEHKHFNRWKGHIRPLCFCGIIARANSLCKYHYQIEYRKDHATK